jgi:hypothetical protein
MAGTGGKREGAGRPKGAAHKRNQEVLEKAVAGRMTPLEVMLEAMYEAQAKGDTKEAATYAKDAAPYCHAKLQSTVVKNAEGETFRTSSVPATKEELQKQLAEYGITSIYPTD